MRKLYGSFLALCFCAVTAWSQQTSTILGTVRDSSGAAVAGANLEAIRIDTNLHRTVTSGPSGEYEFSSLPPGQYRLQADKAGFATSVLDAVKADVGQQARVDVILHVGAANQQVSVQGEQAVLQTQDAQVGNVVENTTIVGLPLNGRNFTQLNLLIPGVAPGSSNNIVTRNGYGARASGVSFSVNGQRSTNDSFILDGINFNEPEIGADAFSPSIDAIQEFRVQTSNFSAEFGAMAGGQINMVTKTGSNQLHGDLYEFVRNDVFDARNYFAGAVKPPLKRNQFGGTVGGRILRDELYYFGSYEGTRLSTGITQTGIVPTAAQASGDMSALLAKGIQLKNPYTGAAVPGNVITAPYLNPITTTILKNFVPAPNASANGYNYVSSNPNRIGTNQYLARVDYNATAKDNLFGRYVIEKSSNSQPKFFPTDGLSESPEGYGIASGWTHVFNDRVLNELKVGLTHFREVLQLANAGKNDVVSQLGMTGLCTDPLCWGVPSMSVSGFAVFGEHGYSGPNSGGAGGAFRSGPVQWRSALFQANDSLYWTHNTQNIRFGMEFDVRRFTYVEALYPRGIFTFDGRFSSPTANSNASTAFADYLFGLPEQSQNSITIFNPDFRSQEYHPWFQDDWRITPSLTVNLGLRYELMLRPVSGNNTISNLDYSTALPTLVTAQNHEDHSFTRSLVNNDFTDVAPRIGLAYVPPFLKSSVVRAGYGVFYQREADNDFVDLAINTPFVVQNTLILNAAQIPSYSLNHPFALNPPASTTTYYTMQKKWSDGYSQQWNVAIQKQVPGGVSLQAAYVGNKDTHLSKNIPINQAALGPGTVASRQPYPGYGSISYFNSQAASTYNALQLQAERRLSNSLVFLGAYTYARCIDDASAGSIGETDTAIQNIHDPGAQKGLCAQDVRHRFAFSYVYELPFGRNKRFGAQFNGVEDAVLGGWEVSGVVTSSTGQPLTAIMSGDNANVGYGTSYPNRVGNPNSGPHSVTQAFNTSAFVAAPAGTFGNARRDTVIGPGINDVDLAALKNFGITERVKLQFRGEFFNLFNHPNFAPPGLTLGTATYGVITQAQDPRELQLSLKLIF
jgi:hypothetical protein